jgi:hypothetical protein
MGKSAGFLFGFSSVVVLAVLFNAFSVARMWIAPGCADCLLSAGVPFPFLAHGGFVTETFVVWRGVLDNVVAIGVVALLFGLVSERMLRR